MFISKELRKKSIAEYLLYMWQVEDIIRAYDCNLRRIQSEYISRFDYDEEQKEELVDWYGSLIRMMREEQVTERGHLQINKNVTMQLVELHNALLDSPKYPFYNSEYFKVLPYIVELRNRGASKDKNEVETCLDALYGVMLLRMKGSTISPETQNAIKEITTLIGMLSDYYLKDKEEPLEF